MNERFDELLAWYPWPEERPPYKVDVQGWFESSTRNLLAEYLTPDVRLVVEIGSWLGQSALYILKQLPDAKLVCIDPWLGNMHQLSERKMRQRTRESHERFLVNLWDYRDRVIPLRATSLVGLQAIRHHELVPDVFFIDGSHATIDVKRDILMSGALNPAAPLIGDDWQWREVRDGVEQANDSLGKKLRAGGKAWGLI